MNSKLSRLVATFVGLGALVFGFSALAGADAGNNVLAVSNGSDIVIYKSGSRWCTVESDGDVYCSGSRKGKIENDGDVYVSGRRVGKVEDDGDIYESGSRRGKIERDGDLYIRGSRVGKIEDDGDIYKSGSRWGKANSCCSSFSAKRYVAGALIFFNSRF